MPCTVPVVNVVLAAAAACNLVMVIPQAVKIVRSGVHSGVSVTGWLVNLILFVAWGVFAVGNNLPVLAAVNLACAVAAVTILVSAHRGGAEWPQYAGVVPVVVVGTLVAGVWVPVVVVVFLVVSPFISRLPHIFTAYRSTTSPVGVSMATWLLTLTTAVLWAVVHSGSGVVVAAGVNIMSALLTVVLLVVVWYRRRFPYRVG